MENCERKKKKDDLIIRCEEKINSRNKKKEKNLLRTQTVEPIYNNFFISAYFKGKHNSPLDVNHRYAILKEVSLCKSAKTIKFLHKVNASERNFNLRNYAFTVLQKFGVPEVRLKKNRKGGKRQGDNVKPNSIETPQELIQQIYNSQLEQMKSFDIFLSHSSIDKDELLKLKVILNISNIYVYVDWVNDRYALKRELASIDTAKVIVERLKASKSMLYVHTECSLLSKWTTWELGYFHALNKPICVYIPNKEVEKPPYLELHPEVVLKEGMLYVALPDSFIPINEWLESNK